MANVTAYKDDTLPQVSRGLSLISLDRSILDNAAASGDRIQLFEVPAGREFRLTSASLMVAATLGAGCTLTLQVDRDGSFTSITGASTAAAASKVNSATDVDVPFDLQGGDIITLLVGGADITEPAAIKVDLMVAPR